ncbi:MAG: glycosyltransferase family 2 protein [Clostridiales bacterium]|nr:glycosyltransferase family 2 protein [Clostridiales bacterium]
MITIMTPSYNRAYILPKLYDSLCEQTKKDFEWVIIDDGSYDDTGELVKKWVESNKLFEIIYRKRENGGKHRAINDAVKIARYEWFFIVDSDDFITANAVERIHEWIKTIKNDKSFAGVSGLRGYINSENIVGEYPIEVQYENYIDATNLQRTKYHLQGDKAEIYRTDILKRYPFPEFEGENFLSEGVVWDKIAHDGYKLRWFNEIIYKCEYIEDGLTKSGSRLFVDNFEGFTNYILGRIMFCDEEARRAAIIKYLDIAHKKGIKLSDSVNKMGISPLQICGIFIVQKFTNARHIYEKNGIRGVIKKIFGKYQYVS